MNEQSRTPGTAAVRAYAARHPLLSESAVPGLCESCGEVPAATYVYGTAVCGHCAINDPFDLPRDGNGRNL